MLNRIKNFKIYILQYRYKYISNLILKIEKHIDYLYLNNLMDFFYKNHVLNIIFLISKNLNISYNNYILNNIEDDDKLNKILNELLILYNNEPNDDIVFNKISPLINNFKNNIPLNNFEIELLNIISEYGYNNIIDFIKLTNNNFELTKQQNDIINEINEIFIPTKIKYFDVANANNKEYYWKKPINPDEKDILKIIRELWIKNKNSKTQYMKIEGFFINDSLSYYIKTCQLNYPILNKKKETILSKIDKNTNSEFLKKFITYDYLGNIYTLDIKDYTKYINRMYNTYLDITKLTFLNIMKKFISKESDILSMYEYIFLLLLGTDDNIDIASLLLGITKEKKVNNNNIYNYLNHHLPYYLLVKIKKSNDDVKQELDKIKSLSIDDIDYKKQLIINKNIPDIVKTITLEKIEETKSINNEYYKQLTFIKNIINFPWATNDNLINNPTDYLMNIENKLNNLTYGHEKAKKSLLQTIGKWISNPSSNGSCFGFVGPPGVGKTLLAKSISNALDIPFAEITLGGQNDGELLHGHGYTYSGSQPGMIIKKMVEMGKSRCILYFDELDKACSKHGSTNEITSILIHLTDPNMNKCFQDRFFQGVDFPLDKVIIIFSYNDSKLVDPILLDRIKQIEVSSYNINEKVKIVRDFIIPEIKESIGLKCDNNIISDELIEFIIENYTNEAGVRSIKRHIEEIFLTLNLDKIYQKNNFNEINKETIIKILNNPKNEITKIHDRPLVGVINGLYATNNSEGGIIPIQIFNNFIPNTTYEIKLTGNQGAVMKESVQCSLTTALNYIKNNLHKYPNITNLDEYIYNNFKNGFHIHVPSTSTPKDGPSAGCAFTCAFISRILNKPIKNDIAMTGEIELTGKITKIGGLIFKLFGAKKAGVKIVYIPKENNNDLIEIINKNPLLIDDNFQVKLVDFIDDVVFLIL